MDFFLKKIILSETLSPFNLARNIKEDAMT